jgi:hypothetical protein
MKFDASHAPAGPWLFATALLVTQPVVQAAVVCPYPGDANTLHLWLRDV